MIEASVIIPTYNRLHQLRRCLQALARQTHPASNFEVVVVVDGSTDGTVEMLANLETPFSLRVIHQSNLGQPCALNRGLAESAGRVSIFLDDDIVVTSHFVAEHLRWHEHRDLIVGIGQITLTLGPGADWFARGFARGWTKHYEELNQGERQPDWDDCYGGNVSIPRETVLAVGGNATDLRRGYDVELAYRLKQYGCSVVYVPEALGNQHENKGFRELSLDSEMAGEASIELARRHRDTQTRLLGHFAKTPRSWMLAWQLLVQANISTRGIERLQRLMGSRGRSYGWFIFINQYYFWKGVRRAMPHDNWERIIHLKRRGYFA